MSMVMQSIRRCTEVKHGSHQGASSVQARGVTRALSDLIPDPDTRAFIGRVYRAWGVDWAAVLTEAIAEGVLIDCGDETPDGRAQVPDPSGQGGSGQASLHGDYRPRDPRDMRLF